MTVARRRHPRCSLHRVQAAVSPVPREIGCVPVVAFCRRIRACDSSLMFTARTIKRVTSVRWRHSHPPLSASDRGQPSVRSTVRLLSSGAKAAGGGFSWRASTRGHSPWEAMRGGRPRRRRLRAALPGSVTIKKRKPKLRAGAGFSVLSDASGRDQRQPRASGDRGGSRPRRSLA